MSRTQHSKLNDLSSASLAGDSEFKFASGEIEAQLWNSNSSRDLGANIN